jgi:putative Mg2+ transporter-C (MgtC) family protein
MTAISQQLADITVLSIVVRILLSTFCAGTLGFERERHNQAAGFRTYIIVSDASALVMMTNIFVAGIGETDLVRMSASVITGLGFLGAGTIIITARQQVKGLTTAAGLWASACLGLAIGAGFYACAFISMLFMIACMYALPPLERRMTRRAHHMNISLEIESMEKLGTVVGHLRAQGVRIFDFEVNRSGSAALPNFLCQFSAVLPDRRDHPELLAELSALDGVILIEEI